MIWQIFHKLVAVFEYTFLKVLLTQFEGCGFLLLHVEDVLLDMAKGPLRDLNQRRLRVLEDDKVVRDLDVLLEQQHSLLQRFNLIQSALLDHLDIAQMSHHGHKQILLLLLVDS